MKLAVIYDSLTDHTKQCADWIVEGINSVKDVEAKDFKYDAVDTDYVKEAKGVVLGSPSYAAQMTPAFHTWMLTEAGKLNMGGKLGGAFATQQFSHGGGELVIQSIHTFMLVWGMLVYSGGGAKGRPVIHTGPVATNSNVEEFSRLEDYRDYFVIFGERFAEKAKELFG